MERLSAVLGCCVLVVLQACTPAGQTTTSNAVTAAIAEPAVHAVRFERNRGQADPRVDFIARTSGGTALISPQQLVLALPVSDSQLRLLRMSLVGSTEAAALASRQLPGRTNYLVGRREQWMSGVEQYSEVGYDEIYPGIGLRYHDARGALQYDFILSAGSDPGLIRLVFDGHDKISLARSGQLELMAAGRRVAVAPPKLWQQAGTQKVAVNGRFELHGDTVTFDVGRYDRTLPLTIDPTVIVYSSYIGGSTEDDPQGIAIGSDSSIYITGCTHSTDFPVTGSVLQSTINSTEDAFVAKLTSDASGNVLLVYATYLGSTDRDCAFSIAVDDVGRAFVTGITWGTDFPVSPDAVKGTWTKTYPDEEDGFVTALSPAGDALFYSTFFGGRYDDLGYDLALHPNGNLIYVTGDKGQSAGVWVIDRAGRTMKYENTIGYGLAYGRAIGIASDGKAVVAGLARDGTLPTTTNAFMRSKPAEEGYYGLPSFIAHIDVDQPPASSILYLSYMGAATPEDMIVSDAGEAYVVGTTSARNFPVTAGAYDTTCEDFIVNSVNVGCLRDAFVMKFDPSRSGASSLVFSTRFGGTRQELGSGIAIDANGRIVITGSSDSEDLPLMSPISGSPTTGVFVARLAADATRLDLSTLIGPGESRGAVLHPSGDICITGRTSSSSFPVKNAFDSSYNGAGDGFVARIGFKNCPETVVLDKGEPFDWVVPELPYCVEWQGGRPGIGLPRRCDPLPGCPRCAEAFGGGPLGNVATPALHDLANTLVLSDARVPKGQLTRDWTALNRRLGNIAPRQFYTKQMRARVLAATRAAALDPGRKPAAAAALNEALNALELNRRVPDAKRGMRIRRELITAKSSLKSANDVTMNFQAGLPAMPTSYSPGWPYATLSIGGTASVEVELDTRWLDFTEQGRMHLLEWNGKEFRNVIGRIDTPRGTLTSVLNPGSKYIVVRDIACLMPLRQ